MAIEQLAEFLSRARENCGYEVTGEAGEIKLPDGSRKIGTYTEGSLNYTDQYKGSEYFEGKEEITENGRVVWRRTYSGGIINKNFREEKAALRLYGFLKKALREFPRNKPHRRGPDSFRDNGYEYMDWCKGDISSFRGAEKILYKGRRIYHLFYRGGFV